MFTDLNIDRPINLIQEVRTLHSLCENGVSLYCDSHNYQKLLPLKEFFDCNINLGLNPSGKSFSEVVSIIHHEPTTKIDNIVKNLIFPKSLIDFCQEENDNKLDEIYFRGLITGKREKSIEKLKSITNKTITIDSSNKGRKFPLKTFDKDYFDEMKKYRFVFCPDGDFVWSYRFFETIMCGAIPIVENESALFSGFYYYNLKSDLNSIEWNKEWVIKNLELLKQNFTYEIN